MASGGRLHVPAMMGRFVCTPGTPLADLLRQQLGAAPAPSLGPGLAPPHGFPLCGTPFVALPLWMPVGHWPFGDDLYSLPASPFEAVSWATPQAWGAARHPACVSPVAADPAAGGGGGRHPGNYEKIRQTSLGGPAEGCPPPRQGTAVLGETCNDRKRQGMS